MSARQFVQLEAEDGAEIIAAISATLVPRVHERIKVHLVDELNAQHAHELEAVAVRWEYEAPNPRSERAAWWAIVTCREVTP